MKLTVLLACSAASWGQLTSISTYTYDLNGHRIPAAETVLSNGSRTQIARNLNGRLAPVESIEDTVVSDSAGVRVTERIVRRFDANGSPLPIETTRTEELKEADGSARTLKQTYRADLNGRLQIIEQSSTVERNIGERSQLETSITRPTLNGSMELIETMEQTSVASGQKTTDEIVIKRRDANGRLTQVANTPRESEVRGNQIVESSAEYGAGTTGKPRITRQTVALREPGGTREVSLYVPNVEGKLVIAQQQITTVVDTAYGTAETTSIRFALPSDPGKLGAARPVETRLCKGNCRP